MAIIDLGGGVSLYTAEEWRTPAHQPVGLEPRPDREKSITEFIGHHSGGATLGAPATPDWLRGIYTYHREVRGYSDIAYNAAVRDSTVWELRPGWAVGGHTLGHNTVGYGVVLLRDRRLADSPFSLPEKRAYQQVYKLACFAAGKRSLVQLTHRQVASTECPGGDVGDWIERGGLTETLPRWPSGDVPKYPGRPLRRGDRGPNVLLMERQLAKRGWRLTVDGYFGSQCETVVRRFQANKGLVVDGVVGPVTWYAIFMAEVTP